jgi:hypothetical protein
MEKNKSASKGGKKATAGNGAAKGGRRRPAVQEPLMDVAPVVHPSVQAAAEDYVETLHERMELQRLEPQKKDLLIELMKKHNNESCDVNGTKVLLKHLYKIETKTDKEE